MVGTALGLAVALGAASGCGRGFCQTAPDIVVVLDGGVPSASYCGDYVVGAAVPACMLQVLCDTSCPLGGDCELLDAGPPAVVHCRETSLCAD
jgi:hypothetical protein